MYQPLRATGLSIPGDISLISFDNNQRLLFPWQISSVDMGIASLGYLAYHLLAGDINIRRDSSGVAGQCTVNHFVSIAPPAARRGAM